MENFMAISKNKKQLINFMKYIEFLYVRNPETDSLDVERDLSGIDMELYKFQDYFMLTGRHTSGNSWDIGFYLKRDDKNDLAENIIILSDVYSDTFVYVYVADEEAEDGVFDTPEILFSYEDTSVYSSYRINNFDFPDELVDITALYFSNLVKFKNTVERIKL